MSLPELTLPPRLAAARARFSEVFVVVSPPRCSSTAFARVFWEQPSVRYYCHEPFEVTYYEGQGVDAVAAKLESPLDLAPLKSTQGSAEARALVIKEMPYQVGDRFPMLAALTSRPIVFLMRDPRLNIASRMARKVQVGDDPLFPQVESGWELWQSQIEWCRDHDVPHLLVDSGDFRSQPADIFPQVFDQLGLPFSPTMLEWQPCPEVELDNLGGKHRHLYGSVLASAGMLPDTTPIPSLEHFPAEKGWRRHVEDCLAIYEWAAAAPERLLTRAASLIS